MRVLAVFLGLVVIAKLWRQACRADAVRFYQRQWVLRVQEDVDVIRLGVADGSLQGWPLRNALKVAHGDLSKAFRNVPHGNRRYRQLHKLADELASLVPSKISRIP